MQSSESTDPIVPSETDISMVTADPLTSSASTLAQLNTLIEESMQIYELEDQKTNIIEDLHNALKIITEFLSFSVNVHPGIFNLPSDSSIVLLPNLELIIKLSNGKTETKKFADYLTEKITFLRTATKQLNTLSQLKENLPNILPTETPENIV